MTNLGLDRYELTARMRPALLALLPLLLVAVVWFPKVRSFEGSVTSLLATCGATYLLTQITRSKGRAVEARAGDRIGRRHTAALLTRADDTLSASTKARYHDFLRGKGLLLPSEQEERADPESATDRYHGAVDWLLEFTRPTARTSQLREENIAYGFRRNLLGLKRTALIVIVVAFVADCVLTWRSSLDRGDLTRGSGVAIALTATLLVWVTQVNLDFVRDASETFARRLLAHCEDDSTRRLPAASVDPAPALASHLDNRKPPRRQQKRPARQPSSSPVGPE